MRSVFGIALVILLALSSCTRIEVPQQHDELVVAVRNTPAFTQEDGEGGFENDLVELFAHELGLKVRLIVVRDHTELIALLKQGKVHFAASATILDNVEGIRYSAPLREAHQVLVQHADAILLDDPADLSGKQIEVLEGSPQAAVLKAMN